MVGGEYGGLGGEGRSWVLLYASIIYKATIISNPFKLVINFRIATHYGLGGANRSNLYDPRIGHVASWRSKGHYRHVAARLAGSRYNLVLGLPTTGRED